MESKSNKKRLKALIFHVKETLNRKTIWLLASFAIIVIGAYIVYANGYVTMQDAIKDNPDVNEVNIDGVVFEPYFSTHFPPFNTRDYNFPEGIGKNGYENIITVSISTVKTVLFVGDNVTFISVWAASTPPTDVSQILVFFIDSRKQVQQSYNFTDVNKEIEDSFTDTPIVELIPSTNQTQLPDVENFEAVKLSTTTPIALPNGAIQPFSFSNEGDKIAQIFLIHNNGKVETKLDTEPIFTVYPDSARLQVTTDIDTIKEIREQKITDADIVGLSWVGIGLALVIIGADIFLRIYLEPYADKMEADFLFNYKKWRWFANRN